MQNLHADTPGLQVAAVATVWKPVPDMLPPGRQSCFCGDAVGPTRAMAGIMAAQRNRENPETVLLVEDDPAILTMVRIILEEAGFEVLAAGSGAEAMRFEAGFQGTIHLLISDVMMPDICGPDLANALKERRPEIQVLLMSGYANGAMLVLNHGWHFIRKPFLATSLLAGVTDLLSTTVPDQGTDQFEPTL